MALKPAQLRGRVSDPDLVPAAGAGQASIMVVQLPDLETGGNKVSVVQPLMGGSGARPTGDGIDGIDYAWGFLRNVPAETIESEMPLLIERYVPSGTLNRVRVHSTAAGWAASSAHPGVARFIETSLLASGGAAKISR
jgi:hypothetical protein